MKRTLVYLASAALTVLCTAVGGLAFAQPQKSTITFEFLPDDAANNPLLSGDYLPSSNAIVESSTATLKPRADWFDLAWRARLQIVISNSGPARTEFPLAVSIPPQFTSVWVRLHGASGDELRVTAEDGKTLIPHFLEEMHLANSGRTCANVAGMIYSSKQLSGTYDLDAQRLLYRVGGDPAIHAITFSGNGLTLANIVSQINATKNVKILARQYSGFLILRPVVRQEYHYQLQLVIDVDQVDAASTLGLTHAPYTANSLATPSAFASPCLNLWLRAPTLKTGVTSFWIYFDNPQSVPSTSDEIAVFSYSTPQPIYHFLSYLNDNVTSFDLSIASFSDGGMLQLGNTSLTIDAGLELVLPSTKAGFTQPLSGAPFTILANLDASDALVPSSFAATSHFYPSVRSTNQFYLYSPNGKAQVTLEEVYYNNGAPATGATMTVEIEPQLVTQVSFNVTDSNPPRIVAITSACVVGDTSCTSPPPILVEHRTSEGHDAHPFYPPVDDLWGITSGAAYLAAMTKDTVITSYLSDVGNVNGVQLLDRGETVVIGGGLSQGRGDAIHTLSTTHPINGLRAADSDGNEANIFLPYFELGRRYIIPRPAQYLSIATTWPGTSCTLRWGSCTQSSDCGATVTNGVTCNNGRCELEKSDEVQNSYPTPGLIYFGATDPACPCSEGMVCLANRCLYPISDSGTQDSNGRTLYRAIELVCSDRVYAYLEDSSYDDEKTLLPAKSHRKPSFGPAPLQDFGAIQFRYVAQSETVELPTIQLGGTIDLLELLSETLTTPANTSIRYQLRVDGGPWSYETPQGLVAAQSLSEANTLAELSSIQLAPAAKTLQLRVVLATANGVNTPLIDALTLAVTSNNSVSTDAVDGDATDDDTLVPSDADTVGDPDDADTLPDSSDADTLPGSDLDGLGDAVAFEDSADAPSPTGDTTSDNVDSPDGDTAPGADTGSTTVIKGDKGSGCLQSRGRAPIDTSGWIVVSLLLIGALARRRRRDVPKRRS